MSRVLWLPILGLAGLLAAASSAQGQARPYIGFVYPAGGQQGATFSIKLGGQNLDNVNQVVVTGKGVSAKLVEYFRKLGNQETTLLREQLKELKPASKKDGDKEAVEPDEATQNLIARIEKRMAENSNRPASVSISALVFVEVTIAPDAEPGRRELRLATPRGLSNPLVFHVGQLPEVSRKPMITSELQVLGKEEAALRKRPEEEIEARITVPCTMNGQIASGEVNQYRFEARRGQRLLISAAARQLIPYIADAVPGWFQPVMALYNARGKEVAYNDDFRFSPDPTIFFEVPEDGEYMLTITDSIYRGREDFVYRITLGELPLVTSIFPLGGRVGETAAVDMKGWNLQGAELTLPPKDAAPGVHRLVARKDGLVSNCVPFELDTLPECLDKEDNNDASHAQEVELPIIVNGRIDLPDDRDVFRVAGHAGDTIVAEVNARRLDSPLDSMLTLTDADGKVLAFNDDHEDAGSGLNTHHADSYLTATLPADGTYYVRLGDTDRNGGEEYAYRLRISAPRPDFALRVVPSSIAMRRKNSAPLSVYAIRKDGFTGDIKLGLKDPPEGFKASAVSLSETMPMAKLTVTTTLDSMEQPVALAVEGRATIEQQEVVRDALPAEDRMQAFLWRHLVPAQELEALVFDPLVDLPSKRAPATAVVEAQSKLVVAEAADGKLKFTKQQVAGRLRQLKILFEDWLLTDEFYCRNVAECEAEQ